MTKGPTDWVDHPFVEGALYHRRNEIHKKFGGQQQGGISTPSASPFIFLFTGGSGREYGYYDFVDDEGQLHYFGEGQRGDMSLKNGNAAIARHKESGKRLLVFRTLGKGRPCRFFGEYEYVGHYSRDSVPDTDGTLRTAMVFVLEPFHGAFGRAAAEEQGPFLPRQTSSPPLTPRAPLVVTKEVIARIRTGQRTFRRRVELIEPACRITGVSDARYLRASHIKPWSRCSDDKERIDGSNGLLLTPNADHLFDKGYISFKDDGSLIVSETTTTKLLLDICPEARAGKVYGTFSSSQRRYLEFHRDVVLDSEGKY